MARPRAPKAAGEATAPTGPTPCAWTLGGDRQCGLPGTSSRRVAPPHRWLCDWHDLLSDDPRGRDQWDVFEAWLVAKQARYCSFWTHYPAALLWARAHGEFADADPMPCNRVDCQIRPFEDPVWRTKERGFVADPEDVRARRLAQQQRRWAPPLAGAAPLAVPRRLPERSEAVPADPRVG